MKLSSEQWKKGISDSHYTGVANLRNVRIDDVGVLRVMNRPTIVNKIPAPILDIKKSYYDISNDYYGIVGQSSDGLGGLYESTRNAFMSDSFDNAYSGGLIWRNYFFPLPAVPNTDVGYWEDTDEDGDFDLLAGGFETLVTKGQTQAQFVSQFSSVGGASTIAMINDDKYIIEIENVATIRDKDGSLDATIDGSGFTSPIQSVFKVSSTACGVVTSDTIYVYNLSGTLLDTFSYDFTRGNSVQHMEARVGADNQFVILSYTEEFDVVSSPTPEDPDREVTETTGYLEFIVYDFNGTDTITQNSRETVWFGDDDESLSGNPHISWIDEDIAVLRQDVEVAGFYGKIYVYEKTGLSWSQTNDGEEFEVTGTDYAPIESVGSQLFIFGNKTTALNWDDSSNTFTIADSSIIAPNGITSVAGSGDYFGIIASNRYSVYKYVTSQVDFTPSIIIRDTMYWANGNSIASLQERGEQDTFDPTDDETYTLQVDALDLPFSTKITALADIGTYMAIGTESGKIYFWDLSSGSFEIPVNIGEPIGAMSSKNNLLYITSQRAGNVYIANLTSYQKEKNLSSLTKFRFDCTVKGMEFFDDGAYMGATIDNDPTYTGIWVYKNGAWVLIGTDEPVTAISKSSPNVLVFSTQSLIYELDIAGSPRAVWTNDDAYVISPMEFVGSVSNKGKGTTYSMYFDEPFSKDEYVKLYYRTTTSGQWQFIQTMTSEQLVADSGLFAFKGQLSVPRTEQIQYKIVLNTTAGMVMFETK